MRITVVSLLALVCSAAAYAQASAGYGTVTGAVREGNGDGIPDTTVTLSNESLGFQRIMTTTDDGVFIFVALIPASGYSLKVSRQGFADWQLKNFDVSLGRALNFRVSLQNEGMEAEGPGALLARVDDLRIGVSSLISRPQVETLPSSGRRLETLTLLAPMTNENPATGAIAVLGEPSMNSFLTDGINTTNTYYVQTPGIAPQLSQEAVSELQVLTAGAPAEFGNAMGGWVNAVTRSGTSAFHGAAYDYFQTGSWNAADRFAPGFKLDQRQNQGGGSVGGPVWPGKLFFFANVELTKGTSQALNRIANPLITDLGGFGIPAANCKATPAQCASAIAFIQSQMNVPVRRSVDALDGLLKLDFRPVQKQSFTVEANALRRRTPDGAQPDAVTGNGGLLGYNANQDQNTRYGKAGWTSIIGGHMLNEVRAGWFKDRISDYSDPKLLPSTGLLGIDVAGTQIGANPAYPSVLSEQRYELIDNFTWSGGSHTVKGGINYTATEDWLNQLNAGNGSYVYPSLTNFADDFSGPLLNLRNYTNFTQTFGKPIVDLHTKVYSPYVQDTWRAMRKLTVIAGVRYDKVTLPQPTATNPTYSQQTAAISAPHTDFSPRVGVVYRLNDRTVVRGGVGFFYEPFPGQLLDSLFTGNAVYQTNILVNPTQSGSPVFPKLIPTTSSIPVGTVNVIYPFSKFRNPYTEQATVAVERYVAKNTTLTASVIDNRGNKLWTASDQNQNLATLTRTYTIDNAAGAATGTYNTLIWTSKIDTSHAHVYQVNNAGESTYKGVVIQLRTQWHDLTLQGSYTWSHAIDDVSGSPLIGFVPATTAIGDYRADQGNSSLNQKNRGVLNWTWQPKVVANDSLLARFFLNGWQVSGIATIASSLGETPLIEVNGQQFTTATMLYLNSINGSGGWARAPFLPVNSLPTGQERVVDARVTRTLPFTERVKGMLMFEAFNVLNSQFNTSVNTIAYTATGGVLRPVPGVGLGNAAFGFASGTNARTCQLAFRLVF